MYRVLIAEDEIIVREWLKKRVRWEAHGLVLCGEAANGQEAFEVYEREKPDIILTDIRMPVLDGISLLKEIRKRDKRARLLILTCLDEFELVRQALKLDVTSYILKLTSEPDEIERELVKAREFLLDYDGVTEPMEVDNRGSQNPRLDAALEYIAKHYAENISLQEISDYVGVTPNYLGKLFLKYCNASFTDELNKFRIEKAKSLLDTTSCRVYEVAEQVGFMNTTYFFRVFKKYEGCTPNEYRSGGSK